MTATGMQPMRMMYLCGALLAAACGSDHGQPVRIDAGEGRLPDKTAGNACDGDAQCPNGTCMRRLLIGGSTEARPAPGGYCTAPCESDAQCGENGECSVPAHADRGMCLGSCRAQSDCRAGYACVGAASISGLRVSGSCQPMQAADSLGDRVAGRQCAADADCLGGSCASTSPLGAEYPGNYCTGHCWKDADCGSGGECLVLSGTAETGWCFEHCTTDADCERRGYRCMQLAPDFKACFPAPDPLPDNTAGRACSGDGDCGGAKDSCANQLPTFSSNQNIAAPGGYCTQDCSLDAECGAGGQCVSRGVKGGVCLALCSDESECRDGYDCLLWGRGMLSKVCVPQ